MEFKGTFIGNCDANKPRTRFGDCDVKDGRVAALLLTRRNKTFPLDVDGFIANMNDLIYEDGPNILIPIKGIVSIELGGGDIATSDNGDFGGAIAVAENQTVFTYGFDASKAGACFAKELYKLKKQTWRVWFVYDTGYVKGTVFTGPAGVDVMAGFVGTTFVIEVPANGTSASSISLQLVMSMGYEQEKENATAFYVGVAAIPDGLLGVKLMVAGGTATVRTSCGLEDVTQNYGDAWAVPALFSTEAGVNPTSVTYADGALTLAPVGSYRIAAASVLRDNDIYGLDGVAEYAEIV